MLATAPIGLLPVLIFLIALLYLDSYKMVELHLVIGVIVSGGLVAYTGLHINGQLLDSLGWEFITYSRYAAPLVEEALKGLIVVLLIWRRRPVRAGFDEDCDKSNREDPHDESGCDLKALRRDSVELSGVLHLFHSNLGGDGTSRRIR